VPVSGSVSDQRNAACVGGSRERARPATGGALTIPFPIPFRWYFSIPFRWYFHVSDPLPMVLSTDPLKRPDHHVPARATARSPSDGTFRSPSTSRSPRSSLSTKCDQGQHNRSKRIARVPGDRIRLTVRCFAGDGRRTPPWPSPRRHDPLAPVPPCPFPCSRPRACAGFGTRNRAPGTPRWLARSR